MAKANVELRLFLSMISGTKSCKSDDAATFSLRAFPVTVSVPVVSRDLCIVLIMTALSHFDKQDGKKKTISDYVKKSFIRY